MNSPIQNDEVNNMGIVPINKDKRVLRAQLLTERQAISPADKKKRDAVLCEKVYCLIHTAFKNSNTSGALSQKKVIAIYSPIKGEPDLTALFQQLIDEGYIVALPVVVEKNTPLKFMPYTPGSLVTGVFGILEPSWDESKQVTPDVIVIPCLGFNEKNYRLGYGGGFYDRTLAMLKKSSHSPFTIGVSYAHLKCDFEINEFDVPINIMCIS
jgi:5-formyltetrahydrofolate cyclo-ligase